MQEPHRQQYERLLKEYMESRDETTLYEAQQFSKELLEKGTGPEKIVSVHVDAFRKLCGQQMTDELKSSFDFLLEVMVSYGFQYREHQDLLQKQIELQSELEVAASMQQTLLPDVPGRIPGVDLGLISVAADKMSGDYYHIYRNENYPSIGVAVADIIGKGIPAALCMSMIKYAIESLPETYMEAHVLLENINRVVEKNIDPSMFITMIYGSYQLDEHVFHYATAGHEPGLHYCHATGSYEEMECKGLVLGFAPDTTYQAFSKQVEPDDMIILFSDGVTESIRQGQFIEKQDFISLIDEYKHLRAQQMVDHIHQELLSWSEYDLKDDQTIVVIKRDDRIQ